ncbi:hypothetical protein AVW11_03870 [Streptomyces amritsarensis]|uniref:HTH luxR-type domain-containing protein n=1 Tax=Streptomyces amritsarensis TaxID=681158 RepID=A0ABX3GD34_9ACTN|nr:helix-turn-helix transcriptional regulator [Streptomyces amritsarensis]OLZ72539.1 hypothetical protein AVW11_03870 [Streptomyces amritsarensis]
MSDPALQSSALTDRELLVLLRAADGDTYERIAADLAITPHAVGKLASRMFQKLGAKSMPNAVLLACHAGHLDGRRQHHGDHNGYTAHIRRRDRICDRCRAGEKAYREERRQAQQAHEGPPVPV